MSGRHDGQQLAAARSQSTVRRATRPPGSSTLSAQAVVGEDLLRGAQQPEDRQKRPQAVGVLTGREEQALGRCSSRRPRAR